MHIHVYCVCERTVASLRCQAIEYMHVCNLFSERIVTTDKRFVTVIVASCSAIVVRVAIVAVFIHRTRRGKRTKAR